MKYLFASITLIIWMALSLLLATTIIGIPMYLLSKTWSNIGTVLMNVFEVDKKDTRTFDWTSFHYGCAGGLIIVMIIYILNLK